jgi:hypothetical protein
MRLPSNNARHLKTVTTLSAAMLLVACSTRTQQPPPDAGVQEPSPPRCGLLFKLALFQDKTGSAKVNRVQEFALHDVEPVLQFFRGKAEAGCEAELAAGLVNDDSNRPLVRVRLTPFIPKPTAPAPVEAEPTNPFDRLYHRPKKADAGTTAEEDKRAWERAQDESLAAFRTDLDALLSTEVKGCTDIEGALARAELFLGEEEHRWSIDRQRRWLVLVTDGIATVKRPPVTLKSQPTLLVVNGSASLGTLARLSPLAFESPTRALQHLIDKERDGS